MALPVASSKVAPWRRALHFAIEHLTFGERGLCVAAPVTHRVHVAADSEQRDPVAQDLDGRTPRPSGSWATR